jgi:succinate dehydrogenase / fumarate reductase flavoprotein subunit
MRTGKLKRNDSTEEDPYPASMRESIKKVEETREERLEQEVDMMNPEERDEVLNKFHPDYKEEGMRSLKVGPNRGDEMPLELADLLEAYPAVDPSEVDLTKVDYETDVLVIGGGGAGTVASLWAIKEGIDPSDILIATKLRHGDANSMMAQGGIQAADKENDSPSAHFLDVIGGGHFANKPELAKALAEDAPEILNWHEDLGIMYDKNEDGSMKTLHGGGTSRKRLHSAKDYTGMELMRTIRDEARNLEVPVVEFSPAIELLTDSDGTVTGALLYNMETEQYYVVRAKSVVMATGGFGRLHIQEFPTTNHYGATADGLVMAYRAGANLLDMDSVQYHPTGAAFPEQIVGLLVTEKVRGSGAIPVNRDGEAFVYNLEPRDVEAGALIRECYGRGNGVETPTGMKGVWLDTPMIDMMHGEGTFEDNLAYIHRLYTRFGIDPTEDPLLVFPTLHYQNGGVEITKEGKTAVEGLFAGGEVEGGVHGKNRLMGNSLLDYNVFGKRAGIAAAKRAKETDWGELTLNHAVKYAEQLDEAGVDDDRKSPMLVPEYRGEETLSRSIDVL